MIDVKFLIEIQLPKIWFKKKGGGKCPVSCQLGLSESWLLHYFSVQSAFPKTKGEHYGRFYMIKVIKVKSLKLEYWFERCTLVFGLICVQEKRCLRCSHIIFFKSQTFTKIWPRNKDLNSGYMTFLDKVRLRFLEYLYIC